MKTNRKLVLIAILVATFLCAMEGTIVSTAMPSIIRDLNGVEYVSMIFSIYLLVCAVTTPIYGRLADLFGRKIVLSTAIILFLVGSFLSGFAQSMTELIVFRAIQGLGAGAVLPLSTTIIGDMFNTEERTRMQALFSGVWAISGVSGPLVGGFIVESLNWRWVFFINLPFGLMSLMVLWLSFHEIFEKKQKLSIDWAGAAAFLISITSLLYVLLFGEKKGFLAAENLLLEAIFIVFLLLFFRIERRAADPFLPLTLLKSRIVLIPNLFGFFAFSFLIATTVYFPMWIQEILHKSPTASGFALTFITLGWPIGSILNARLIKQFGPWKVTIAGALLLAISGLLLLLIDVDTPMAMFYLIMFLAGIAFGLTTTVLMIILQNSVEWNQRGVVMSSNALLNTLGQTIFIAIFGAVFNSLVTGDTVNGMVHGMQTVFLCVASITVLSFLIALRLPRITKEQLFQEKPMATATDANNA